MSLDVSSSWTVREVKEFAAEFSRIESRVAKAIVAVSMLIIGPIALSMLVLMDALRGANHLVESLYWRDRSVEPARNSPALAPQPDPIKEILDEVEAIKAGTMGPGELKQKKIALVEKVLEAIYEKRMDKEETFTFVERVIDDLGENFRALFGREALKRMREDFLDDFIQEPLEAVTRLQNMGSLLEKVFHGFDKQRILGPEDVIPIMNAIRLQLRQNLSSSVKEQKERVAELIVLVGIMEAIGFPKNEENFVDEIRGRLSALAGMIQNRRRTIEPIVSKLQKFKEHAEAVAELTQKIEREEAADLALSEAMPKEREIHRAVNLKAQPENSREGQEFLQKQIEELQKEKNLLGEDGEKFREISPKRLESKKQLDVYRKELKEREAALKILIRDEFGGASGERLKELIGDLQVLMVRNLGEIELLQREMDRPIDEEDIVGL